MAQLQGSSLIDCLYIPDFIGSGTVMVFESTSAPTSWTKSTANNNKALRVVNGTISTGGSSSFSTVLSPSRSLSSPGTSAVQTGYQLAPAGTPGISIGPVTPPVSSVSGQLATFPPHTHSYQYNNNISRTNVAPTAIRNTIATASRGTDFIGGNTPHTHTISGVAHSHPVSDDHNHPITESPHAHGVSFGAQPFAVYYRDVILATKD